MRENSRNRSFPSLKNMQLITHLGSSTTISGNEVPIPKNLLEGKDVLRKKREQFVIEYIRPFGIQISASERAPLEIETLYFEYLNRKSLFMKVSFRCYNCAYVIVLIY